MLKISRLLVVVLLYTAVSVRADSRATAVILDADVLAPNGAAWLHHRDIIVRDTSISAIQPTGATLPDAKYVFKAAGKYVIPGLFDNRVRVDALSRPQAGLFIAYGITSVRDAGSDATTVSAWRREIAFGKLMGPRIVDSRSAEQSPASGAGAAGLVPGLALHDEMARLIREGARPADVLRRATIESARAHGRAHDLGSIEIGKIADLIVLDGDPLTAIDHTRDIDAVVFRGEVLTRAHLNQLLSRAGKEMQ